MRACRSLARILFVSLSAAALVLAGCGGDDNKDSSNNNGTGLTGGGSTITQGNVSTVYGNAFAALGAAMSKGPGTYHGTSSGTVVVAMSTGKVAQNVRYSLVFDNYSDDGITILDGTVTIAMSVSSQSVSYTYTGNLDISGTYQGTLEISLTGGSTGMPSGYVKVNGTKYNITNGTVG